MKCDMVKLEDICFINMGKTPSRNNPEFWGGNNNWVAISDLKGSTYISDTKECITDKAVRDSNCKLVPSDTLLYSFKLSIGKVAITQKPLFTNEAIVALPIKDYEKVDNKYLYYAIQTIDLTGVGDKAVKGVTLNKEKLKQLKIPLPPLPIQKQIADTLDKADALRKKDQELVRMYDELTQAIFYEMFGDPFTAMKKWRTVPLKEVTKKITDGEHGTVKRVESGRKYLMARNVRDSFLDLSEISYISENDHQKIYKRCNPEVDDLLLVCVGATIGRVCLVPKMEEFSLARSVALIKPDRNQLSPIYLQSLFKTRYLQQQIANSGNSSAQAGLYTGKINELQVYVPPISLQRVFEKKMNLLNSMKLKIDTSLIHSRKLFDCINSNFFKS